MTVKSNCDIFKDFPTTPTPTELYQRASTLGGSEQPENREQACAIWRFLLAHREAFDSHLLGSISFKLGEHLVSKGKMKEAEGYLRDCLRLIPGHRKAAFYLGEDRALLEEWRQIHDQVRLILNTERYFSKQPKKSGHDQKKRPMNLTENSYWVTAIISAYKSEKQIAGCLLDLEKQTIADRLQIVVINSGSPQNEEAIVRDFQRRYANIEYFRTPQRETIYQAWNRAVQLARGAYLTNANTDDRHRRDALEIMARCLDERPEIDVVYADQLITSTLNVEFDNAPIIGRRIARDYSLAALQEYCFINSQPMWRRSLHAERNVYFDEQMEVAGDYDFWLRVAGDGNFHYINDFLGLYYRAPDGSNKERQNPEQTFGETYISQRNHYWRFLQKSTGIELHNRMSDLLAQIEPFYQRHFILENDEGRHLAYLAWALSLHCERIGEMNLAEQIAGFFQPIADAYRLSAQLSSLAAKKTKQETEK